MGTLVPTPCSEAADFCVVRRALPHSPRCLLPRDGALAEVKHSLSGRVAAKHRHHDVKQRQVWSYICDQDTALLLKQAGKTASRVQVVSTMVTSRHRLSSCPVQVYPEAPMPGQRLHQTKVLRHDSPRYQRPGKPPRLSVDPTWGWPAASTKIRAGTAENGPSAPAAHFWGDAPHPKHEARCATDNRQ
uniref:Uncharacterized protein n=1 Tax=Bombyx mori TaxID=7091 RepID=A0A8R2QUY6_BOMMO|nr:uncharacterized protein LOC119629038 [Bombyx mori]